LHWRIWNGKAKKRRGKHRPHSRCHASFPVRAG
jgi:hypothetical protein